VFNRRILVPFCPQSQLSGIGERGLGDVVWYRRRFAAPAAERLLIHFGAVDYRATVWVNGSEVARHEGGHTPFTADVTGLARGKDNVVVVRAEDPLSDLTIPRGKQYWKETSESIFYTPTTGIWQTVWLEPLPSRHLHGLRVLPDPVAGAVELQVAAEGRMEVIVSLAGAVVGRWSGAARGARVDLDTVARWSPESPRLYDVEVTLLDADGRELDRIVSYFGLRTIEARDGRLWLNGRPYVQRLVLDQGYFPGGQLTAAADEDLRRDIELARALGFNGVRKHQKVEDPRWLYWADVLGLLVWAEMPSAHQYTAAAAARLTSEWRAAVLRDRDHPSIAAWVPVNESSGIPSSLDEPGRARFLVAQYRLTKELDGSRPVVSNDGWEHAVTDLCTLHDYSPAGELAARYRSLRSALDPGGRPRPAYLPHFSHRGEPIIVSEFGGLSVAGSGGWGYSSVTGPDHLLRTYRAMISAMMGPGPVEGFCYTQLTDVEQERNGLLTFERQPKVDPDLIRPITRMPKRIVPPEGDRVLPPS
jgi:beta-galactosidase/beta-glucuronidase